MFGKFSILLACAVLGTGASADDPWGFAEVRKAPVGPPRSRIEMENAKSYLETAGTSPDAPRVMLDVLMAATIDGDQATADEMRRRLILDHPGSIQQQYLLTTTDSKSYRELLTKIGNASEFSVDFSARFVRAMNIGFDKWGAQFLTDDHFLLLCGLATQIFYDSKSVEARRYLSEKVTGPREAQDMAKAQRQSVAAMLNRTQQLHDFCRAKLTEKREGETTQRRKFRAVAELLFDTSLAPVEKCLKLHAIEDSVIARALAEHFDARLSDEESNRADLVEARIERLLEQNRYDEAITTIDDLIDKHGESPKRLFWRSLCRMIEGDRDTAAEFQRIAESFPEDPWTIPTKEAATIAAELDARLEEQASALAAIVRKATNEKVDIVEFEGEWRSADSAATVIYGMANLPDASFEAVARRGDVWIAAIRSNSEQTSLLLDGSDRIQRFPGPLPFDIPRPKITLDPVTRQFGFSMAVGDHATPGNGSDAMSTDATLSLLRTLEPAMARHLLAGQITEGRLPRAMSRNDDRRTYTWIKFNPRRPETQTWSVTVADEDRTLWAEGPGFAMRSLKYGAVGTFTPSSPTWPEQTVLQHEKPNPAILFQLVAAATRLFTDESPMLPTTAGADRESVSR